MSPPGPPAPRPWAPWPSQAPPGQQANSWTTIQTQTSPQGSFSQRQRPKLVGLRSQMRSESNHGVRDTPACVLLLVCGAALPRPGPGSLSPARMSRAQFPSGIMPCNQLS